MIPEVNVPISTNANKVGTIKKAHGKKKGSTTVHKVFSWKNEGKLLRRKPFVLQSDVRYNFPKNVLPFNIYEKIINLDPFVELLISEINISTQQSERFSCTTIEQIKGFDWETLLWELMYSQVYLTTVIEITLLEKLECRTYFWQSFPRYITKSSRYW